MSMDECLCLFSAAGRTLIDLLLADSITAYGRKTVADVCLEYPNAEQMTVEEARERLESLFIDPVPVPRTRQQYQQALEMLPPEKWRSGPRSESFMMSEFIVSRITRTYVRIESRYFTFRDCHTLTHEDIVSKATRSVQSTDPVTSQPNALS